MAILARQEQIDNYKVVFLINEGEYAETYRVKDNLGKNYFMKLYNYAKLHRTQFDENGNVLELIISRQLRHRNLSAFHDSNEVVLKGQKMAYIVYDYIIGETVYAKVAREQGCHISDAKMIVEGVLSGLSFLHNLSRPVLHNEVTIQNVMLDMSTSVNDVKLIDFGYARFLDQPIGSFRRDGLNPFYMAPEAFNGVFSVSTDLYAAGAMLYHLIFGMPPHFRSLESEQDIISLINDKERPLMLLNNGQRLDESIVGTLAKALAPNVNDRFSTAEEFIKALRGEIHISPMVAQVRVGTQEKTQATNPTIKQGNGFEDVAGMDQLKEQLQSDVIDLLQNQEQAESLGLNIPNGLLFYGPPGCGKTYFAEKFAEQMRCNYKYIKCSDVASPYIHGGQEKIAAIFDDARKNAPTILFFDEIDAMIKDRSKHTNVSEAGEVNEFLAQLNNCGHDRVIVIGATNKPNEIDEAALRAGRLELKYYIPQPDFETRKQLFMINLKKRKADTEIDYEKLANMTENYVSADIRLIVDTAARLVFRRRESCISMSSLEEAINSIKPSVTPEMIKQHELIRDKFEGNIQKDKERKKIGF